MDALSATIILGDNTVLAELDELKNDFSQS